MKQSLRWLFAGLVLLFSFATNLSAQETPEQSLAQWYEQWDQSSLTQLNQQASAAYIQISTTESSLQELMNRNRFYWFWPDFESAIHSMWPDYDLACVDGQSSTYHGADIQSYYIHTDDFRQVIATVFHENIHTDVVANYAHEARYFGREGLIAYGFRLNDGSLTYFDEAFVEVLSDLMMQEAGFTGYTDGGYSAGTAVLRPMLEKVLQTNVGIVDLYWFHTYSLPEQMFILLGKTIMDENGIAYNRQEWDEESLNLAVYYGYQFALEVQNAQYQAMYPPIEPSPVLSETPVEGTPESPSETVSTAPVRQATCGMWLWFTPTQYELINRAYRFPSEAWIQNDWGNWRIIEEDYYAVIDTQ